MRSLFKLLVWVVQKSPKHYKLLLLSCVATQRWKVTPYCEIVHILQTVSPEILELGLTLNHFPNLSVTINILEMSRYVY